MFDEELDQLGGGRRNTFSEWSVTTALQDFFLNFAFIVVKEELFLWHSM